MQKMPINKLKTIMPYTLIILLGLVVYFMPVSSGDEFWNYNFARNMSKGLLPYRDFNMVQTPLSACIPALLMKVFGAKFMILRVAGSFLFIATFACLYYICETIKSDPLDSLLRVMTGATLLIWVFVYNYNHLMILILLLIYIFSLKEKKLRDHAFIGLLSGIAILVKQNTGLAIMAVNFFICLYLYFCKKERKPALIRFLFSLIPGTLFFIYLVISKTLDDFWEYAVFGVTTFSHRHTLIDLLQEGVLGILVGGFAIFFLGYVVYLGIRCWRDHGNEKGRELFLYALAGMAVIYPLCDGIHLLAAFVPMIPVAKYYAGNGLRGYAWTAIATVIICSCFFTVYLKIPLGAETQRCTIRGFEGLYMRKEYEAILKEIADYVTEKEKEGHQIRFADEFSVAVSVAKDRYQKNWDMLLVGNIGRNGVEDLLDEEGSIWYVVRQDEEELGEQNYFELIHYIKENYRKVDEVMEFEVYEKTD